MGKSVEKSSLIIVNYIRGIYQTITCFRSVTLTLSTEVSKAPKPNPIYSVISMIITLPDGTPVAATP